MLSGDHFAVIKPDRETRWLKFHDDRVTPVTDKEVLEDNYGGESANGYMPGQAKSQQVMAIKRSTTAYMLVYIRDSRIDQVLAPLAEADTPIYLSAFSVPSLTI
jgi:ubiquitin carboxyl-terminal hydrolase 7